ncbi:hypothetical protein ACLKA6_018956, partial [Drosophila palustris]
MGPIFLSIPFGIIEIPHNAKLSIMTSSKIAFSNISACTWFPWTCFGSVDNRDAKIDAVWGWASAPLRLAANRMGDPLLPGSAGLGSGAAATATAGSGT